MKPSRHNARTILLLLVEAMLLFSGLTVAVYVRLGAINAEDALIRRHGFYKAALATIFCLTSFYLFDLYDFVVMHDRGELVLRLLQALELAWVATAAGSALRLSIRSAAARSDRSHRCRDRRSSRTISHPGVATLEFVGRCFD